MIVDLGCASAMAPSSMAAHALVDSTGEEHRVLVVRIEDTFYALGEICSHADVSFVGGEIWPDDCAIECPKHGSLFSLETGEPTTFPATKPVPTYVVSVSGDQLLLELP